MTIKTIPLPMRSTKETREYAQAVEKGLDSYFVVQNGKGWYVRKASLRSGNGTLFPNKEAAVDQAKKLSSKRNSEYLIFDNTGTLISRKTNTA